MTVIYILNATIMGGATISFMNMLDGLMQKGVTPVIVIPKGRIAPEFRMYLTKKEIQYFQVPIVMNAFHQPKTLIEYAKFPLSFIKMQLYSLLLKAELKKIVTKLHPDIIHTNVGVIHAGAKIADELHIPHVFHLREYQDIDFGWKIYPSKKSFEDLLQKSSAVITITDGIRSHFHLTNNPSAQTIYNGIFHETESVLIKEKSNYFLCMSRIIPEKGHHDVIAAFSRFYSQHPDYRLIIAGFGSKDYIKELKVSAERLRCKDAIDFIGFQKDVTPHMSKAKALIVASRNEGFGRMTAEACFMGSIVIGRNTAGTKEILEKTGGLTFMDTESLLARMEEVSQMPDDAYGKIVSTAQQKATRLFSTEQNVNKIYSLYNQILNRDDNQKIS